LLIGIFIPLIVDLSVNRSYYDYMNAVTFNTPKELQVVLGERVRRLRLARNTDQRTTADKAGISEKALRNLEAGRGSTVETLLRTLKALDALQGIEMLAPEVTVDPIAMLHASKPPQRVRRPRKQQKAT
jgi:DNA-binding XRE family transcriptional regulator